MSRAEGASARGSDSGDGGNNHKVDIQMIRSKMTELERKMHESGTFTLSTSDANKAHAIATREFQNLQNSDASVRDNIVLEMFKQRYHLEETLSQVTATLKAYSIESRSLSQSVLKSRRERDKLQDLCRELSLQNKHVRATARKHLEEQTQTRELLQKKFDDSLHDINQKIAQSNAEREQQRESQKELENKVSRVLNLEKEQRVMASKKSATLLQENANLQSEVARLGQCVLLKEQERHSLEIKNGLLAEQVQVYSSKFGELSESTVATQNALEQLQKQVSKTGHRNQKLQKQLSQRDQALKESLEKRKKLESLCQMYQERLRSQRSEAASAQAL